jgi:hypothetical protein
MHSLVSVHAGQQALLPALAQFARGMASAHPEIQVYAGPQAPKKAVTLRTLRSKYEKKQPICMATAYDYPSAVHVSRVLGTYCSNRQLAAVLQATDGSTLATGQASRYYNRAQRTDNSSSSTRSRM